MMKDVKCPYCNEWQEICHDDGYGYEEDTYHEQECGNCEKTFVFTTTTSFYYNATQAPCKNGGEHDWNQIIGFPEEAFIGKFRCAYCDEEEDREPEKRKAATNAYLDNLAKARGKEE